MNCSCPVKCLPLLIALVLAGLAFRATADAPPAPAAPAPAAASLITNGGFEDGIVGWGRMCRTSRSWPTATSMSAAIRRTRERIARGFRRTITGASASGRAHSGSAGRSLPRVGVDSRRFRRASSRQGPGLCHPAAFVAGGADAAGGHLFIAPGNRVTRDAPADPVSDSLPTTWTQIEAVVEIPKASTAWGPAFSRGGPRASCTPTIFPSRRSMPRPRQRRSGKKGGK